MPKWTISGIWDGEYWYEPQESLPTLPPKTAFTLTAKRGWFGGFKGQIEDRPDPSYGPMRSARVSGWAAGGEVNFSKQYSDFWITTGKKCITFREQYEREFGISVDSTGLSPPVDYSGFYDECTETAEGKWIIRSHKIRFMSGGQLMEIPDSGVETSGRWTMRRRRD